MAANPPEKILIIDDDSDVVDMIQSLLKLKGYEPIATTQWTEAVGAAEHEKPNLMLLDLNMPTIDGGSLLKFLREQGYTFPVVVVSGYIDDHIRADLTPLGVVEFVDKPFEIQFLADVIENVLADHLPAQEEVSEPETPSDSLTIPASQTPEDATSSEPDSILSDENRHNPGVLTPRKEPRADRERVMVPPPRKSVFLRRRWAQYLLIAVVCVILAAFLSAVVDQSKESSFEIYPTR